MIMKIVNAPISYFDTTPSGWILNRFSKDIDKLDRNMADTIFDSFDEITSFFVLMYVISLNSGYLLLLVPLVSLAIYFLTKYYIKSY